MADTAVVRMPVLVRAITFVMALQFVGGLLVLPFALIGVITSGSLPLAGFVVLLGATLAAQGLLIRHLSGRKRWIRWGAVGFEVSVIITHVLVEALDPGLTARSLLTALPLPAVVIVLLLLPAAGGWFCRSHGSSSPQ